MYNDEKNLYHYTYRKGGENTTYYAPSGQTQSGYEPEIQEMKPVKKKHRGVKMAALVLACALLGGAAGAGVTYMALGQRTAGGTATINVSGRPAVQVKMQSVDGKTLLSDAEVYAANVNSVVSINTTGTSGVNIFGQPVQTASAGSGFILTADGYIATNHHVVAGAENVKVSLYNGDEYAATVIGGDEDYDIAVLKISASGLQPVTLGDSDSLNVGDRVLAIGNPLGELTFSQTGGMVSSVNRPINVDGTPFNMIQTDASINPGNSGGPLFNQYGEVVGIVSAKYSSYSSESVEGLGFAIPMNDVFAMIQDIMTNGYITNKPYLAVTAGTMNAQMAQQTGLTEGVYIYSVEEGGAAAKAGLQVGDVITKIGDTTLKSLDDLTAAKKSYKAGDTATFTIYRGGQSQTVELTWDAVPADKQTPQPETQDQQQQQQGQYPGSMEDLFDYFFNRGFFGQSSGRNAA